jgi:hypothetical protein
MCPPLRYRLQGQKAIERETHLARQLLAQGEKAKALLALRKKK